MMHIFILFLLFQIPIPAPHKAVEPPGAIIQSGGLGEEHIFRIGERCYFYANKGYAHIPKRPAAGNCRKFVDFYHVYHSPLYWVWDLTDEKAPVMLYDKTYAFAGNIVVEAPKGHLIKLKVAGR